MWDKYLEKTGKKIIKKFEHLNFIDDYDLKIGFVRSYEKKSKSGKMVLGECKKVNEVYQAYIPYDFLIIVYDRNVFDLDENQIKVLLLHELMHITIGPQGPTIAPHDVEEFNYIINKLGIHWLDNQETPDILEV